MALLLRVDVDRPFGKRDFFHQLISRVGSDCYFPPVEAFHYLDDLKKILNIFRQYDARSCVFFRRCTFPSASVMELMDNGKHVCCLHLENSRSFESFVSERSLLESFLNRKVNAFSKHGSGRHKYGWHHYAPYEPEKYVEWGDRSGMEIFFGNLEDATIPEFRTRGGLTVFPAAYWLEPHWRDTTKFTKDWLCAEASVRDVVLLLHPDNVLAEGNLLGELVDILNRVETKHVAAAIKKQADVGKTTSV